MLYWHHGINMAFSGNYNEYFSPATNVDAVVYLMLANDLIHQLLPQVSLICTPVQDLCLLRLCTAQNHNTFRNGQSGNHSSILCCPMRAQALSRLVS